jgi:hypothetical protein
MARNLVPLFVDKQSGDIVASKNPNLGSGPGNPNATPGYEFIQITPLDTWIIPHNTNTKKLLCQIYDDFDVFTLPDDIQIFDDNTVIVTFGIAMAGSAKIIFF